MIDKVVHAINVITLKPFCECFLLIRVRFNIILKFNCLYEVYLSNAHKRLTPLPVPNNRTSFGTLWHNSRMSGSSVFTSILAKGSNTERDSVNGGILHRNKISALKNKVRNFCEFQFSHSDYFGFDKYLPEIVAHAIKVFLVE